MIIPLDPLPPSKSMQNEGVIVKIQDENEVPYYHFEILEPSIRSKKIAIIKHIAGSPHGDLYFKFPHPKDLKKVQKSSNSLDRRGSV